MVNVISRIPEVATFDRPLMFVHGAWHAAWCWAEHFLPWFAARGYEVHALDLRGHGGTPLDGSLRLVGAKEYLEDIHDAVSELGREPVLIGHSMGGYLVQRYLIDHPLERAALLATVPYNGVIGTTLRLARSMPLPFLKVNGTWSLYPLVAAREQARQHFFCETMHDDDVARHHERLQDESYRAFLDMLLFKLPRPGRVTSDVFVLGGGLDTIFPVHEIEATASAYGTDAVIIDGLAHDVMLDTRWEEAAVALDGWLRAAP